MLPETNFLIALALTLISESLIVILITKYLFRIKKIKNVVKVGIIASTLTLPYLWFVLPPYIPSNNYLIYGELVVFLIESMIYKFFTELKWEQAFLVSLIANAFSFCLGLLINF